MLPRRIPWTDFADESRTKKNIFNLLLLQMCLKIAPAVNEQKSVNFLVIR